MKPMPDKLVTLATFSKTYEAELARNRLEAEGAAAHLSGEASADLWNLGTYFDTVQLQVAEADLERAGDILDSVGELPAEEAVSPLPPVVVISAANKSQAQAIAVGAADYLQEPVELKELAAKVQCHAWQASRAGDSR
jgi:DNA-binding response OmpR family regulator